MNIDPSLDISHPEAEAALQALRDALHHSGEIPSADGEGEEGDGVGEHDRLVEVLRAAGQGSAALSGGMLGGMEGMDMPSHPGGGDGRAGKRRKLPAETGGQRQELQDSVQTLMSEFMGSSSGAEQGDSSNPFVSREDYENLKARYDALLAQSASASPASNKAAKKRKRPRQSVLKAEKSDTKIDGDKRKVRSLKLEHLIHQMANRRLGVAYTVSPYNVAGFKDLPDPGETAPGPEESVNGVQEIRPDFRSDMSDKIVVGFLEVVREDVRAAWDIAEPQDGQELEEEQLVKGVETYWTSLCKRFKEQEINSRGEETKQQLGRRKQNQYRRQQSLVARRLAAFDASPLNACRLRALYRGLLTIPFAPRTEERPDPKRTYSLAQWTAYRKLSGNEAAYEVVDQFWLSDAVRQALLLLDTVAEHNLNSSKRHGRPKGPAPTFHLPSSLWDQSELPILRPKLDDGLPDPERAGAVIFRWQVSDSAQRNHPEWAVGLYDDPPIPAGDAELPKLEEILSLPTYRSIRRGMKEAAVETEVPTLSAEEVEMINADGVPEYLQKPPRIEEDEGDALPEPPAGQMSPIPDGEAAELENMVNLASHPMPEHAIDPALALSHLEYPGLELDHKAFQDYLPSPPTPLGESSRGKGTSQHARKQRKKGAQSMLPEGAAMPVPRRAGIDAAADDSAETRREMQADLDFLQAL